MPDPVVPEPLPITTVQLELTSRCNLSCVMCPLTTGDTATSIRPGHVSDEVWARMLRAVAGAPHVLVVGYGENLVNPRWHERLLDIEATGTTITFVTNAIALRPDTARRLAALGNLRHLNVSIDSPDPEVYRAVRGGDVRKALAGLRNAMAELPADLVSVSSVAMRDTLPSLTAMPQLLADLGVRHYLLQGLTDYNDFARGQHPLADPQCQEALATVEAECARLGISYHLTLSDRIAQDAAHAQDVADRYRLPPSADLQPGLTRRCTQPWELPYLDKDGGVHACCNAAAAGADPLGSLAEEELDAVWAGPAYQRFRDGLLAGGAAIPAPCRSCTLQEIGVHPMRELAAEVVDVRYLRGTVQVTVRNSGVRAWTPDTLLRVGTAGPRDHPSPWATDAWLSPERAATHQPAAVAPGETASFGFPVSRRRRTRRESFQLVADGVRWLSGTTFVVDAGRPPWRVPGPRLRRRIKA